MPLPLVAALWAGLAAIIVPLAVRVVVGLGLAVVTYLGVSALLDNATSQLYSYLGGVSSSVLVIIGMARVDDFIAVILSALSAKLIVKGLTQAGALKAFTYRGG
mgnify:FL=1